MTSDQLAIDYMRLEDFKPAKRNPKLHDTEAIIDSIERYGFVTPMLRDGRTGRFLEGHGRTVALQVMRAAGSSTPVGVATDEDGMWLVPVTSGFSTRDDLEAEGLIVMLNQTTRLAGWDTSILGRIVEDMQAFDPEQFDELRFTAEQLEPMLHFDNDDPDPDAPAKPEELVKDDDLPAAEKDDADDGELAPEDQGGEDKRDVHCPECGHYFRAGDKYL